MKANSMSCSKINHCSSDIKLIYFGTKRVAFCQKAEMNDNTVRIQITHPAEAGNYLKK